MKNKVRKGLLVFVSTIAILLILMVGTTDTLSLMGTIVITASIMWLALMAMANTERTKNGNSK